MMNLNRAAETLFEKMNRAQTFIDYNLLRAHHKVWLPLLSFLACAFVHGGGEIMKF